MSRVPGKFSAQSPSRSTGKKVALTKFIWLTLYLIAGFIHHIAYGDSAVESLVTVLAAFSLGLITALIIFCLVMKSKWNWHHVLHRLPGLWQSRIFSR
jgi:hypothetical protein